MSFATQLSGFWFLLVIITNLAADQFGYVTFGQVDVTAKLKEIGSDTIKFKIGFTLIVIEHTTIVALAWTLFAAYRPESLILAAIWAISRSTESLMQIYNKRKYWRLGVLSQLELSEKNIHEATTIFESKDDNFFQAQIFFSLGTLSYCILFVISGLVPAVIAWFGIIAVIPYGIGNVMSVLKLKFKGVWSLGGLLILLFELILGIWLLFFS